MASVNKNEILKESSFMAVLWRMIKKFWLPESSDEYWAELFDYAEALMQEFPGEFYERLILAYVGYLDQKWRNNRKRQMS